MHDFIKHFNRVWNTIPGLDHKEVIFAFSQSMQNEKCIRDINTANPSSISHLMHIVERVAIIEEQI